MLQDREQWPKSKMENVPEIQEELRKTNRVLVVKRIDKVVSMERFSKYLRLIRCVAWIRHFIHNIQARK